MEQPEVPYVEAIVEDKCKKQCIVSRLLFSGFGLPSG